MGSVFFVYGKLIWVKNTYMFAVKYIYIMFEEFFISCESIHESIKSVFDRFLCSDCEEMDSHTIIFYFIRYKLIVFRIYTHPAMYTALMSLSFATATIP